MWQSPRYCPDVQQRGVGNGVAMIQQIAMGCAPYGRYSPRNDVPCCVVVS